MTVQPSGQEPSLGKIHSFEKITGKKSPEQTLSERVTSSMNRFVSTSYKFSQEHKGSVEEGDTSWIAGKGSFSDFIESIKGINQQFE